MRKRWLALPILFAATTVLPAQQPAAPSAQDLLKLDEVLLQWEKSMTNIDTLEVTCNRISVGLFAGERFTETYEGKAKFIKGQRGQTPRASLEMHKKKDPRQKNAPDVYEKYICTGTFVYVFAPQDKVIRIHQLPAPKPGQVADDNFLSFLFGMKAVDAKKRYKLTYVPPLPNDKWYYYVKVEPIALADKADFSEARLTLWANSCLPRELWFKQPNGNTVTWDFPRVTPGADIRVTDFAQPALPAADWRYVQVPADVPPRVIRPNR
jgi:TIGR03009 family protein